MGGHGKDASTRGQLLTRRTTGTRIRGIAAVLLGVVALSVEIENTGESGVELSLDWFEIEGADGLKYKRAPLTDAGAFDITSGAEPGARLTWSR